MGLAAKSIPPPSWVAPRKHGLARTSPLREDQQRRMSEFFRHWWKSRGLSERALAGYLGVTKSVARNKLEGISPLQAYEPGMLPTVIRNAFSVAYTAYLAACDSGPEGIPVAHD